MSNPTSIPQFLRELKEDRDGLEGDIQVILKGMNTSTDRIVSAAGRLIDLGTRRDITAYAIETLHRGAAVGNQDPVYRLQMLEDLLLDRLFGEINTSTTVIGHGAIAVRQQVLRGMIHRVKGLRLDIAKGR